MKVRPCPSPRMFVQITQHYGKPSQQRAGDTSVVIPNAKVVHVMPDSATRPINIPNTGRKVRMVKRGKRLVRRVSY